MQQIKGFLRYFIRLAYLGTHFHGWQVQPNAYTVQQHLNDKLSTILGQDIYVVGAGRTDTGVHAREMYAHFDAGEITGKDDKLNRLNKMLGPDVALYDLWQVPEEAHSRFDATGRSYEYHLTRVKNPFLKNLASFVSYPLNSGKMNEAAQKLRGTHDFSSFSKSRTQTYTNECEVKEAYWKEHGDHWIFYIRANRFLRNMVRAIVGTLLEVGQGRRSVEDFEIILQARDRRQAGESVPAHGLYLTGVEYPQNILNGQ